MPNSPDDSDSMVRDLGAHLQQRVALLETRLYEQAEHRNNELSAKIETVQGQIGQRFSDLEVRLTGLETLLSNRMSSIDTRVDAAVKFPAQLWVLAIAVASMVTGVLVKLFIPGV